MSDFWLGILIGSLGGIVLWSVACIWIFLAWVNKVDRENSKMKGI